MKTKKEFVLISYIKVIMIFSGSQQNSTTSVSVSESQKNYSKITISNQLYERIFEEEYNLIYEGYYIWLKQNHPTYAEE